MMDLRNVIANSIDDIRMVHMLKPDDVLLRVRGGWRARLLRLVQGFHYLGTAELLGPNPGPNYLSYYLLPKEGDPEELKELFRKEEGDFKEVPGAEYLSIVEHFGYGY